MAAGADPRLPFRTAPTGGAIATYLTITTQTRAAAGPEPRLD